MRILFGHGTPRSIARSLTGHEVTRAAQMGWHEVSNGELIEKAERAGYELLLNRDQSSQTGRVRVDMMPSSDSHRLAHHWHPPSLTIKAISPSESATTVELTTDPEARSC